MDWLDELEQADKAWSEAEAAYRESHNEATARAANDMLESLVEALEPGEIGALIACARALPDVYSMALDGDLSCGDCQHTKCKERREILQQAQAALVGLNRVGGL